MGLKIRTNKKVIQNRAKFESTTNMKTKADAIAWINSSIDAANSVQQLKAQVKEFQLDIVNVVFNSMGIEE
jgi:hypothetical protein